jgi:glycosyltransferase involved in cell wall biosynthesis
MKIKILIPVYNDWQSVSKLLDEINNLSISPEFQVSVIIVNDASNHDRQNEDKNLENIHSIKILDIKINQGHARCIATGLKYIYEKEEFNYVIPMDGDGEDRPEEIVDFLNQIKNASQTPIVGERIKRSENLVFKVCYQLHKLITLTFTGKTIKFGNFTCLSKTTVEKMINEKATWNSFSGALKKV